MIKHVYILNVKQNYFDFKTKYHEKIIHVQTKQAIETNEHE